jgi:hypothetical protein
MDVKQLIKSGLDNAKRATDRALEGLTPEEIKWQPKPDANSIGLILFHMARLEDTFVQTLMQHKPQIWESEKWCDKLEKAKTDTGSHYTPEQVASFCTPNLNNLQDYSAAVRQKTLSFVDTLTPEKLDEKLQLPPFGPPPTPGQPPRRPPFEPIVGFMLMMTVTHIAEHAGEISYLRGLKRGMDK